MITLKSTNNDGVIKEMTFSSEREAAAMLREMFGDDAFKSEQDRVRNETNAALRAAWRAREVDPMVVFSRGNKSE